MDNESKKNKIGFGTGLLANDAKTSYLVSKAIECGYRIIDTASRYENEESDGKGIRDCGLNREEIHVTSKVSNEERWQPEDGYTITKAAFERSLNRLQTDYIDLYLIHWPVVWHKEEEWRQLNAETWNAMEEMYHKGLVKAIGVSNFLKGHIDELEKTATIYPAVNQIEVHPLYAQTELREFCKAKSIIVQSWGPLQAGKILDNPKLIELADKYDRSVAQLILRWDFQNDVIPIVKSSTVERMKHNIDIFDFEISPSDMFEISLLDDPITGHTGAYSYMRQLQYN